MKDSNFCIGAIRKFSRGDDNENKQSLVGQFADSARNLKFRGINTPIIGSQLGDNLLND